MTSEIDHQLRIRKKYFALGIILGISGMIIGFSLHDILSYFLPQAKMTLSGVIAGIVAMVFFVAFIYWIMKMLLFSKKISKNYNAPIGLAYDDSEYFASLWKKSIGEESK